MLYALLFILLPIFIWVFMTTERDMGYNELYDILKTELGEKKEDNKEK